MRFRACDGFRGLCSLLVALYHLPVYSHFMAPDYFLPNAQIFLDFFFVFSGFIIAAAYGDKLKRWPDLGTFALRRFARLWPLHAVVLGVFVAVELAKLILAPHAGVIPPFTGPHPPLGILTSLLLVHSLDVHTMLVWNAPSWTVSVEFYTYLIYGVLVIGVPRRPMTTAIMMALFGALLVALLAPQLTTNYDYGLFRCWYGFFCGVIVWRLWRAAPPMVPENRWLATLLEIFCTVGVFVYVGLWGSPPLGFAGPLVFAGFIYVYASERGAVTALMRWPPLVRLGEISYSIYLVHYLIVVLFGIALRSVERLAHVDFVQYGLTGLDQLEVIHFRSQAFMDGVSVVYLIVVVLVSNQTCRLIEEPGRRLFGRLDLRRRPRAANQSPAA